MNASMIVALINNAALLLSIGLLYDTLAPPRSDRLTKMEARLQQVLTGVALGGVGIALMLAPWTMIPGLVFDTRTVLLSLSGMFFGGLPTLVAMLITASYRLSQGGAGVWMGVAIIVTSGLIGIAWRRLRRNSLEDISPGELYAFGVVVHIDMLLCTFLLPSLGLTLDTLSKISLPVMVIYPVEVMLLGLLLSSRLRRKQAEQALRESEARWQFALEGAGDGVWDWNAQTNRVRYSRQWKAMLGYNEDEIGDTLDEWELRLHPEDRPMVFEQLQRCMAGETPMYTSEHRLRCKDGAYKWILDRGKIIERTKDGRPLRLIGTLSDIDQRRRDQQALVESEKRLAQIVDFLPDALLAVDQEKRIIIWNRAIEQMTGVPASQMLGRGEYEYARPFYGEARPLLVDMLWEEQQVIATKYYGIARQGETLVAEATVPLLNDGKGAFLWGKVAPLRDPQGVITGAIETIRDITDRKTVELALRASEARFRRVFEAAPLPLILVGKDGSIGDYNARFGETFGYSHADIPTVSEWFLLAYPDPDYRRQAMEAWAEALQRAGQENTDIPPQEYRVTCKNGTERTEVISGIILEDSVLVTFFDITERKQAEEKIKQSEAKYRGLFENAVMGIYQSTPDGRLLAANQAVAEMFGYGSPQEAVSHVFDAGQQLYARLEERLELLETLRIKGVFGPREYLMRRRDGKPIWITITAREVRDTSGNLIYIEGTTLDVSERKQVEQQLRVQMEKAQQYLDIVPVMMIALDATGNVTLVNKRGCQILGYSESEVLGINWFDHFIPPDVREDIVRVFKRIMAGDLSQDEYVENRVLMRNGEQRLIAYHNSVVRGDDGVIVGTLSSGEDITVRRQAEEQLRLQGLVLEQIQDNVTITDLEGRITYVNDAECRLLKRSREELLGQHVTIFGEDPARGSTQAELLSAVLAHGEWRGDIVNYASDGTEIILDSRVQMVYDLEGKPLALCGISTDITERVWSEQRLAASEAELRALFTAMQDLVLTIDREGVSHKMVVSRQDLLVRPVEEQLGRSIREFFPAEQAERFIDCVCQALTTHGPAHLEYPLKIGEQPYWFSAVISPLTADTAVCVIRDITESKQAEEQIKESLREKEALLRELYHRTKNNMQVIRSMLVLQSADTENEEVKRLVQETNNKIQAMALVHQMLYQSGNLTSIDLETYIQDLTYYAFSSYRMQPNQIDLQLNLQSMLVTIDVAIPLGLILNELLSNAFKHAFPDGRRGIIRLDLSMSGDHTIWLQFSDDGVGVPAGFDLRNQKSYGLQSMFGIAEYQLGGQVEIDNRQGLAYSIKFSDEFYE